MGSTVQTSAGVPADPYPGKRVFSFPGLRAGVPGAGGPGATRLGPALVVSVLAVLFLAIPAPSHLQAQRPAELEGRVTDPTGTPIEGVELELVESGEQTTTGPAGRYRFRSLAGGQHTLRASRIGYLTRSLAVDLEAGVTMGLDLTLQPAPVTLEGLTVRGRREPGGGVRLDRSAIEASGATSAGGALETVPGVVVVARSAGGPETVSIRGSASDAVLVLVDGVVVNDPLTGEADLSQLAAASIESITVLPGARSARYGPRAEAGVILIETRASADRMLEASVGALGSRGAGIGWGGVAPVQWSAGGAWRQVDGGYDYTLPPEVGGGDRRRENADAERLNGWLGVASGLADGQLRVRATAAATRRGLPGLGFLPSPHARQATERVQGSVSWRLSGPLSVSLSADAARHGTRHRDPDPPAGLPYADTATVDRWAVRAEVEDRPVGPGIGWGGGLELRHQRIAASQLTDDADARRLYAGAFGQGSWAVDLAEGTAAVSAQLRGDRDPALDDWLLSRAVTLSYARGGWAAHVANRSSYSPPTLSDQYFRDAIGVEPNPDLRAERVPSEWEVGLRGEGRAAGLGWNAGVTGYVGDVRDMIVWSPDFRFVWSPRNVDVNRSGIESRVALEALAGRLRLEASHTYARTTYDRPGQDTVQVIYRPRHAATLGAAWRAGRWRVDIDGRYTGERYPTPSPANALPGFWTLNTGVSVEIPVDGWAVKPSLRTDRLLDETASLIFGFPEPGRTWRLALELRPRTRLNP